MPDERDAPKEVQDQMEEHLFPDPKDAQDLQGPRQDIQVDPNLGKQPAWLPSQQPQQSFEPPIPDEDIGDAERGPSPQDIVHQLAAQRRSSRRSRMGLPQDAQPEQAFQAQDAEMDKRMDGEGGAGQDKVEQSVREILEEVKKGVQALSDIKDALSDLGGLG